MEVARTSRHSFWMSNRSWRWSTSSTSLFRRRCWRYRSVASRTVWARTRRREASSRWITCGIWTRRRRLFSRWSGMGTRRRRRVGSQIKSRRRGWLIVWARTGLGRGKTFWSNWNKGRLIIYSTISRRRSWIFLGKIFLKTINRVISILERNSICSDRTLTYANIKKP